MRRLSQLSSFQAFRYPGFAALWVGLLISNIGTWMATIALGVSVTAQTHSALWTGTVVALSFLPAVLLAPIAGALADRFERRKYISVMTLVQMAIALTLAALAYTGHLSVGAMSVLSLLNGCAGALGNPAFVALMAELVPPAGLNSALSLSAAQYNLGRIVGPALAAAVFAVAGPTWAFIADAASFGAVLFVLARIPGPTFTLAASRLSVLGGMRQGFAVVRDDPGIRLALCAVLVVSILVAPFIGFVPVYAMTLFRQGPETASLFTACQGIGAVIAAVLMGPIVKKWGLRGTAVFATSAVGLCALAFWSAPSPAWVALAMAPLGGMYMCTLTSFNTIGQVRAPRAAQARVSSIHQMALGGGYAIGLVVMGALGDIFGLRVVMGTGAILFFVIALTVRPLAARSVSLLEPDSPLPNAAGLTVALVSAPSTERETVG